MPQIKLILKRIGQLVKPSVCQATPPRGWFMVDIRNGERFYRESHVKRCPRPAFENPNEQAPPLTPVPRMNMLRILYQDPFIIAVDKPSGFHVHPPEHASIRISDSVNCLAVLRRQIDRYLYPIHRLYCATTGVLLFALDSETARDMNLMFQECRIEKSYYCVVRGWMEEQTIDRPLSGCPSATCMTPLARIELPFAVGRNPQHPTPRYSLLRAGRYHQIRRHLAGASHPIIGDTVHGDGDHNRFFRTHFQSRLLLLKSQAVSFTHPRTARRLRSSRAGTGNGT